MAEMKAFMVCPHNGNAEYNLVLTVTPKSSKTVKLHQDSGPGLKDSNPSSVMLNEDDERYIEFYYDGFSA